MLRTAQIALVLGLLGLVVSVTGSLTASAETASFDCSKASTKVEKAICGDDELAKLDYQLGQAYQRADHAVPANDQAGLVASQRTWLKNRDSDCNAPNYNYEACLAIIYRGRLAALSDAAKGDQRSLDNLLWTDGIACRDNQALIRFAGTVEDDSVPANDPPNVGGSLRHAPAQPHQQCRLRDGRVVRYKVASMDDAEPFGPCGAQEDQIYSVWIGDKKVISREQRAGKCDSNPVRAIYFDGSHLTRCSDEREWNKEEYAGTHSCSDISAQHLNRVQTNEPEGVFLVSAARPADETFCQSFVHKLPPPRKGDLPRAQIEFYDGDDDWPQNTAMPAQGAILNELHNFDLFNKGRVIKVISIRNQYGGFQGSFYAVPPSRPISTHAVKSIVSSQSREPDPAGLRKLGFKVFSGDQIKNLDAAFTEVDAFRANGSVWLFERPTVPSLEVPTEVISRAQEDGSQKLVCTYQAQPNL